MTAMKNNYSDKHEELYSAMNIEYQAYIKHLSYDRMYELIRKAESQFPNSYNIKRAIHLFNFNRGIETKAKVFDED